MNDNTAKTSLHREHRHGWGAVVTVVVLLLLFVLFWIWMPSSGSGGAGGTGPGGGGGGSGRGIGSDKGDGSGKGSQGSGRGTGTNNAAVSGRGENQKPVPAATPSARNAAPEKTVEKKPSPPQNIPSAAPVKATPGKAPDLSSWEKKDLTASTIRSVSTPAANNTAAMGSSGTTGGGKGGSGSGKMDFYGIELEGKNIAFLLDTSGSMSGHRLDRLKTEMLRILKGLQNPNRNSKVVVNGSYRIYVFNSEPLLRFPDSSRGSAIIGRSEAYEAAVKFIDVLAANGGTNMLEAWRSMFGDYDKVLPDTVYFLSDGAPTDCSSEQLLAFLRSTNLPGQDGRKPIRIHCVSIGNPSPLLKGIAGENGGRYTEE